jgi:hypothetical protein
MGVFSDLFSNKPAKDAAYAGIAARQAGLTQGTNTLQQGYGDAAQYLEKIPGYLDTAKTYAQQASSRFDPLTPTAQQGFTQYGSLYGLGGADPMAAVRAQPGYQFSQDEASEAVKRNMASTGALASGNTLQAISDRSANIADTKWQQYAEGLKPFLQLAPLMAQMQGGYDVKQGDYEAAKTGYATGQAGLETELAKSLAALQTGTANADANALSNAELARSAAAKNVFDAVMGGAKLAVGAYTGMPTGGGGGGSMFSNLFGGGNPSSASYGSNPFGTSGQINPAYLT